MKKTILVLSVFLTLTKAAQPEYDGAYLLTKKGRCIDVPELSAGQNVSGYFSDICLEKEGNEIPSITKSNLKNFFVKGGYDYTLMSFHRGREYEEFGRPFICFDSKKVFPHKTKNKKSHALFQTKNLKKGFIVAWIGKNLWVFKLS